MKVLRFGIAQLNFTVGDIESNLKKIQKAIDEAHSREADVLVMPELAITGYPPEDLVFKSQFINANLEGLRKVIRYSQGVHTLLLVGFIEYSDDIYNSVALIYNGELIDVYHKIHLSNYGVFDEKRYFKNGDSISIYDYRGVKLGVNICEDLWYPDGPGHFQAALGDVAVLINLSASPYHTDNQYFRERMYSARAGDETAYVINCNLVGGQDELVFDGCSTAYDVHGNLIARLKAFEEDFQVFDLDIDSVFRNRLKNIRRREHKMSLTSPYVIREIKIESKSAEKDKIELQPTVHPLISTIESIYRALVIGTRDYTLKNGFKEVIIGISGGIDSALVTVIAVEALGSEHVHGIFMPSQYSASISREDAHQLAENLGIRLIDLNIQPLFSQYLEALESHFEGRAFGVTEENLQSRIRGNIIMAFSNKFGWLVLTTGNKSEMSTGYATLYGDMAGGFAVLKDVLKTRVYELAEYINREREIIPRRIIERPPSAELRENQKDTDTLPEYQILDKIIKGYVEEDKNLEEIMLDVNDEQLVRRVIKMIDCSEYKRRQSPPGIKVTPRAFGRDHRMPITNRFRL